MHGFILDVVIDADHEPTQTLAVRIAHMLAERDDVKSVNITLRCNADPTAIEPSILDS